MSRNLILFAGVTSLFQAVLQLMFASLCIAQYFCVADFLREIPYLIFIKIVYFMNPSRCGSTVNIGQALEGIANQAFVLMESEPFTTTRTFIINCTSLGISLIWTMASCILLAGGARKAYTRRVRWPWITATVGVCAVDVVATVCYANDTFHTRTLRDVMKYIGGTASGISGTPIDTSAAPLIMVVLYSRCVVFFILNVILIVLVALNENAEIKEFEESIEFAIPNAEICSQGETSKSNESHEATGYRGHKVEAPVTESSLPPEMPAPVQPVARLSQTMARPSQTYTITEGQQIVNTILEPQVTEAPMVSMPPPVQPLASMVQKEDTSAKTHQTIPSTEGKPAANPIRNVSDELDVGSNVSTARDLEEVSFNENYEKLRAWHDIPRVYFNRAYRKMKKNLFNKEPSAKSKDNSLLEIAEYLIESRRNTAAKRQRQMPNLNNAWSYIPAEGDYHMRDNLPSDEDLPPIPLPDYSAVPHTYRKASVHRAPSNLAAQRRTHMNYLTRKLPHEKLDVLY